MEVSFFESRITMWGRFGHGDNCRSQMKLSVLAAKIEASLVELVNGQLDEYTPRPLGCFRRQIRGQFMCTWEFVILVWISLDSL